MSATLLELQRRWLDAVLDPDSGGPVVLAQCTGGVYGVAAGLAVYVNHVRATVLRSLAARYPATQALLGRPTFERAVAVYLRGSPPKAANLDAYGEGFPEYATAVARLDRRDMVQAVANYECLIDQLALTARMPAGRGPAPRSSIHAHYRRGDCARSTAPDSHARRFAYGHGFSRRSPRHRCRKAPTNGSCWPRE